MIVSLKYTVPEEPVTLMWDDLPFQTYESLDALAADLPAVIQKACVDTSKALNAREEAEVEYEEALRFLAGLQAIRKRVRSLQEEG